MKMKQNNWNKYKAVWIGGIVGLVFGFIISFLTIGIRSLYFFGYVPMKIATLTGCDSWQCASIYIVSSMLFYTLIRPLT